MNKSNVHLFLPFVQALAAGKTIEYYSAHGWEPVTEVGFNGRVENYRIKTVKVTKYAVMVRDGKNVSRTYDTFDEADQVKKLISPTDPDFAIVVEVSWEE